MFLLLSLLVMSMTAVSRKSRLLSAEFRTGVHRRCRVVEEDFHLYGEVNVLMISS
jgi:hypothetical protein